MGNPNELEALFDQRLRALSAIELSGKHVIAMREIMPVIIKGDDMSQEESLRMERQAVLNTLGNAESQKGIMAFLQKRNMNDELCKSNRNR